MRVRLRVRVRVRERVRVRVRVRRVPGTVVNGPVAWRKISWS